MSFSKFYKSARLKKRRVSGGGVSYHRVHLYALTLGLLNYALWGQPTPDHLRLVDMMIAIFLLIAIGWRGYFAVFFERKNAALLRWATPARIFMIFGLSVPLIIGAINGHQITHMARDMVALFFWLLPVFLLPMIMRAEEKDRYFITALVIMVGVILSLRLLLPPLLADSLNFAPLADFSDPHLHGNMPSVLFAGLFLFLYGLQRLYYFKTNHDIAAGLGLIYYQRCRFW